MSRNLIWSFPSREKRDYAFVELYIKHSFLTARPDEDNPNFLIQSLVFSNYDEHVKSLLMELGGTIIS